MELISSAVRIVFLTSIFILVTWLFKAWRQDRRLSAFPGPFLSRFCEFWHAYFMIRGTWYMDYAELCTKYGTIARIGPNELITNSPEVVMQINSVRKNYTKNPWWYSIAELEPGVHNVFSLTDEKEHGRRRDQVAAGYTQRHNNNLDRTIDHHIQNLINLLRHKYCSTSTESKPVDLARKVQYFTVDMITDLSYSKPLGDLASDEDLYNHIKATVEELRISNIVVATGLFPLLLNPTFQRIFPTGNVDQGLGRVFKNIRHDLQARIIAKQDPENPNPTTDMASSWLKNGLTTEEAISEVCLSLIAGADSNAHIIRSTILFSVTNPAVYRKLQQEIDNTVRMQEAPNTPISNAVASKLPYLQAVIKESMRILPAGLDPSPKITPPEGDTFEIDGKSIFVPGGTSICASVWGIQRRKEIFGEDVEVFRPERWLDPDTVKVGRMGRSLDLMFGYGRWSCLGMGVAKMQISKVVFELFKHFDFALLNPQKPWEIANYLAIWSESDMWMRITERVAT